MLFNLNTVWRNSGRKIKLSDKNIALLPQSNFDSPAHSTKLVIPQFFLTEFFCD